MTKIYDFDNLPISDRNGSYGGNSGDKEGVFIGDEYWLIKYPKNTRGLSNVGDLSYTMSPLSEYIGSHIYALLGYAVHETLLGIRNDKLVVACRDLCDNSHRLIEFRQLKNTYNRILSQELEKTFLSTGSDHFVNLNEIRIHLKYNPELQDVPMLKERFWDCVVIDGFLNNNDRNNGNWGILRNKKEKLLAPVYDNGSSFSPNIPEDRIARKLVDATAMRNSILNTVTAYSLDGERNAKFYDLMQLDIPELNAAILRTVPKILDHIQDCCELIESIPENAGEHKIISAARKEAYCRELELRAELILEPALERVERAAVRKQEPSSDVAADREDR